jgi:hypothetical protein
LAQQVRERIDKWDYMKLKWFCTIKERISKLKRPPREWEEIFVTYTSEKELITRIYGELKTSQKNNDPKKKCVNELN